MSSIRELLNTILYMVPDWLIATLARIAVGTVFLRSGLTKIEGFSIKPGTFFLFAEEYKLPVIPPELAAYMATTAELTLPFFLFAGFLTRYAALALLGMTLVIQLFVYPNAFDTHGLWAVALLFLMKHGAGPLSVDALIGSRKSATV